MKEPTQIQVIAKKFTELFHEKYGTKPEVNWGWTGKIISDRLQNHSLEGIIRIIELYFEDSTNEGKVYHLPTILSAYSFNKYLPKMKYDPDMYDNAAELNEKLY